MVARKHYRAELAESREEANHARRIAWLVTSRDRAEAENDDAVLRRLEGLLRAEEERHVLKLDRLRAAAG